MRRTLAFALGVFLLAGCTTTNPLSRTIDYQSATSLPPLEVPPELTTPKQSNRYAVPELGDKATTLSGYERARAQQTSVGDTTVLPSVPNMQIQRDGDERWLVVSNVPPEKLWDKVKAFWQKNGFVIKTENPAAGVMETDWAENRAKLPQDLIRKWLGKVIDQVYSTSERDMFRTRLEPTPDGHGTVVYVTHRGMQEVYDSPEKTTTVWQPRPADPGLEAEFLRRLMVSLGSDEQTAQRQIAEAPDVQRAVLKKGPGGSEQLALPEPFDRAWRRVGVALDRMGFTVEDRNREQGLYYVRYADPDAKVKEQNQGFFSKLFSGSSSKVQAEQYQVAVVDAKDNSVVRVLDKNGKADDSKTAQRILALLHEQLK